MNGSIIIEWVKNQLTPMLHQPSVIVMNNASYHSKQVDGSKAPTSATRKPEMIQWLRDRNVVVDQTLTKPKLYDIIKQHKENAAPTFHVDTYLRSQGHKVLRLPPYHCKCNPIELIWGDLKGYVAQNNTTFRQKDVRELIERGLVRIDQSRWSKACDHVQKIEEEWWKRDNILADIVAPVIHNLADTDSKDEEEEDSDSELC